MELFEVDRQSCKGEGICAAVCPLRLISLTEDGYPAPVVGAEEICLRCGHCVAVCPEGSLAHRDMPVANCPPVREDLGLNVEHCEHFLRSRRSIRLFKDKPVPRADIARLIEIARYAPSGCNCQCAEWLVINNRQELNRFISGVAQWMRWMLENMPDEALAWHMDKVVHDWDNGNDISLLHGAPVMIIAHASKDNPLAPSTCTIALTYLELAAKSMGLGCCWAGLLHMAAIISPPIAEALGLPDGHQIFGVMMVGYPQYDYYRIPTRKSPSITWR
jgi:nitroreductase/NAD-dependent dihydropyrimidine dehydrogenase PreA subunit